MKTLVINGKIEATGHSPALLRAVKRIVKKKKLKNPEISLMKGIIFKLEEEA